MKKLISLLTVAGLLLYVISTSVMAESPEKIADKKAEQLNEEATEEVAESEPISQDLAQEDDYADTPQGFHQVLKTKFIEGNPTWMTPILICLILGLALVIERIIYLNLATTNAKGLLENLEQKLNNESVDAAKELCRDTKGPVASIFYQGLDRIQENIDIIEKSLIAYGGVQMARLESNLTWISLFIAIAPMLGFLGTVIGMVQAFDSIERAGDISPTVVAGGMKVALLTTVFGLITAIILQLMYNYLIDKIESLVNTMEDSTITFMDIVVKYKNK